MRIAATIVLLLYGLLMIAGGGMGYAKDNSMASLLWGGGAGVVVLVAFVLAWKQPRTGALLGAVVGGVIAGRMGMRYWSEGAKFMPSGVVAIVSAAVALFLLAAVFAIKKKR